ncbi:MAG: hypothetical protein ABI422_01040 [Sphingomicrobium sp.]
MKYSLSGSALVIVAIASSAAIAAPLVNEDGYQTGALFNCLIPNQGGFRTGPCWLSQSIPN